jgi:hypothetical protein
MDGVLQADWLIVAPGAATMVADGEADAERRPSYWPAWTSSFSGQVLCL